MNLTKNISFILIISILSLNLSFLTIPKNTIAAIFPTITPSPLIVSDPGNVAALTQQSFWDDAVGVAKDIAILFVKRVAMKLINNITNETVKWIGGFGNDDNPPPSFASDIGQLLEDAGDAAIGDYISNNKNLQGLCTPFKAQIKLALGYSAGLGTGHLFDGSNCSLTSIVNNVTDGVDLSVDTSVGLNGNTISSNNSFSTNGGWDSWIALTTVPQNNINGAYLMAKQDMAINIQTEKDSKTIDLANGSGALSLKSCVDSYTDGAGNPYGVPSDPYIQGTQKPTPPGGGTPEYTTGPVQQGQAQGRSSLSYGGVNVITKTECTVKTPGAIITGMLDKSVNSDKNMSELTAALGNGVDAIFNALVDALFTAAVKSLKEGIFDEDTIAARAAYDDIVDSTYSEQVSTLQANLENSMAGQDVNNPICWDSDATNFGSMGVCIYPSDYTPTATGTGTGTGTGTEAGIINPIGGSGTSYNGLVIAQNNAINLLNSLIRQEASYQRTYLIAQNILTQARNVFASSSNCSMQTNLSNEIIRSFMIRSNVIRNIDGTADINPDSYRNPSLNAQVPWNLITIQTNLGNANTKLDLLQQTGTYVQQARTVTAVADALIPVNSTSFDDGNSVSDMITNIRIWLGGVNGVGGVGNMYNSLFCPINLTNVLQISTP